MGINQAGAHPGRGRALPIASCVPENAEAWIKKALDTPAVTVS